MILELCANSFESAQIAEETGLDRIELCENLSVGGVTPNKTLIKKVVKKLNIPTHVLIRPRKGDFVYTIQEIERMIKTIKYCKDLGCTGVVSGVLTRQGDIDVENTTLLMDASNNMEFTFHRAFDVCNNPLNEIETLKKLGVTRVLTSGQATTAKEGVPLLTKLLLKAEDKLQIMPGGGINSENILDFQELGFKMVHFSAIQKKGVSHSLFENEVEGFSDKSKILKIKALV